MVALKRALCAVPCISLALIGLSATPSAADTLADNECPVFTMVGHVGGAQDYFFDQLTYEYDYWADGVDTGLYQLQHGDPVRGTFLVAGATQSFVGYAAGNTLFFVFDAAAATQYCQLPIG